MVSPGKRIYFDSSVFIAWFNVERERYHLAEQVLRASRAGEVGICTSTATLAEISYIQGIESANRYERTNSVINALLLDQSTVELIPLNAEVGLRARELTRPVPGRRERLEVLDAIQAASAEVTSVDFFASFDGDFQLIADRIAVPIGPPDLALIP